MISARLDQVLAEQSAARREQPKAASELEAEIAKSDREQVIEKVPTPGSIASPRCGLWMPTARRLPSARLPRYSDQFTDDDPVNLVISRSSLAMVSASSSVVMS